MTFGLATASGTKFDEFAFYDRVLSAVRIAAHHSAGVGPWEVRSRRAALR